MISTDFMCAVKSASSIELACQGRSSFQHLALYSGLGQVKDIQGVTASRTESAVEFLV